MSVATPDEKLQILRLTYDRQSTEPFKDYKEALELLFPSQRPTTTAMSEEDDGKT